jgi:chemotaxis response regulator CheB
MSSNVPRRRIQPKLRSIPTRKSPSAIYIQMHQLANEKERLHQELAKLCDRQIQIAQRLQEVDRGLIELESEAVHHAISADTFIAVKTKNVNQLKTVKSSAGNPFDSMTIEY